MSHKIQTLILGLTVQRGRLFAFPHFTRIVATFGYMEEPNVPRALALARKVGVRFDIMSTSFFLNRRSFRPSAASGMPLWLHRNDEIRF